jgi:hypothetical protein
MDSLSELLGHLGVIHAEHGDMEVHLCDRQGRLIAIDDVTIDQVLVSGERLASPVVCLHFNEEARR